jgi:hypothetical protein
MDFFRELDALFCSTIGKVCADADKTWFIRRFDELMKVII